MQQKNLQFALAQVDLRLAWVSGQLLISFLDLVSHSPSLYEQCGIFAVLLRHCFVEEWGCLFPWATHSIIIPY